MEIERPTLPQAGQKVSGGHFLGCGRFHEIADAAGRAVDAVSYSYIAQIDSRAHTLFRAKYLDYQLLWKYNTGRNFAFVGWDIRMNIIQTFYDNLASQYDQLFLDWQSTTQEQAVILNKLFRDNGFDETARILDCACGIGTQAIGLAKLGYNVTASDISDGEIAEAIERASKNNVAVRFAHADFCALSETFSEQFHIVIAMDNALPHMLSASALETAIESITNKILPGGLFVASIRDYDALLLDKPPYSPPYIHKNAKGQKVSFQTWTWEGENYKLIQYIIVDEASLQISKFECEYRATRREEITNLLLSHGCSCVVWAFPEETGFYQPIVIAKKQENSDFPSRFE